MTARHDRREPLEPEIDHILEESRMILPGIQALFGFQLIAVFNPHFAELLPRPGQLLHLTAIVLVAGAVALIMAPAAYHRQAERDRVSRFFARYASRMLTLALTPLSLALAIEVSLVTFAITQWVFPAASLGVALVVLYVALWFLYPRFRRRLQSRVSRH